MIQRFFWLVYLILITLAAALGADMTVSYISGRLSTPVASVEKPSDRTPQGVVRRPQSDYDIIATRNMFNANPKPPDTPQIIAPPKRGTPIIKVEETPLQLKLAGTVVGADKQYYAIIEDASNRGQQGMYQVGDSIQNRIIAEIQGKCVLLDQNGKYERLCFQNYEEPATATSGKPQAANAAPETDNSDGGNDNEDVVQVDNATWQIRRELMQEQFANLGGLSQQARVTPYIVQGETRGFRLTRLKADSLLQKIGLQHGDVLQKVNGSSLTSPADALQAYQQLQQAGTVRLEILRRNRASTLTYEIR